MTIRVKIKNMIIKTIIKGNVVYNKKNQKKWKYYKQKYYN